MFRGQRGRTYSMPTTHIGHLAAISTRRRGEGSTIASGFTFLGRRRVINLRAISFSRWRSNTGIMNGLVVRLHRHIHVSRYFFTYGIALVLCPGIRRRF